MEICSITGPPSTCPVLLKSSYKATALDQVFHPHTAFFLVLRQIRNKAFHSLLMSNHVIIMYLKIH